MTTEGTTLDNFEYYRNRLQETFDQLASLDDSIHASLNDVEYATDVETCEVYIDSAKRAIYKATRATDTQLSAPVSRMSLTSTPLPSCTSAAPTNSQLSSWNPFRATLRHGRVFGNSFSLPLT